jgi:DNA invertase Pin-like site-specific DNA recombinase
MGQMMGYARVSTPEQNVSLQRDALHQEGCREEHVFLDIASGARTARPGLAHVFRPWRLGTRWWCGG